MRDKILFSSMCEYQKQDHNLTKDIFHKKVIKSFIDELIKEMKNAFDISNLPVLNAFLKIDAQKIPNKDSLLFENYGVKEVTLCIAFMEKVKKTAFKGGQFERMLYMIPNFYAFYWSLAILQVMFVKKRSTLTRIFGEGKIFKVHDLFNARKCNTRKRLKEIKDILSLIAEKVHNPVSVEDLLQDSVIETAFPSMQRLLKIYVLIPMTEAIVERFSQNGTNCY